LRLFGFEGGQELGHQSDEVFIFVLELLVHEARLIHVGCSINYTQLFVARSQILRLEVVTSQLYDDVIHSLIRDGAFFGVADAHDVLRRADSKSEVEIVK